MPVALLWAKLALESGPLMNWLWRHRADFEPSLKRVGDFASIAVADPTTALRRIGNTIVFGPPDGGAKVVAFIEPTAPESVPVTSTLADPTLAALHVGHSALSSFVPSLLLPAMIPFGFAAVLPIVLQAQFAAFNRRLAALYKSVNGLHKKFDAEQFAKLSTGLDFLKLGVDSQKKNQSHEARQRFHKALGDCINSAHYSAKLLGDELDEKAPNREVVRALASHFSAAFLGAAACHIGLEADDQAVAQIETQVPLLQKALSWVFRQTAGKDPARFFTLPVDGRNARAGEGSHVTLAFMADLFHQAKYAGAVDGEKDYTPSGWFDQHRKGILAARAPLLNRRKYGEALQRELLQAVGSVEIVNRVRGVEQLIRDVRTANRTNREVMAQLREIIARPSVKDCPYIVWSPHGR